MYATIDRVRFDETPMGTGPHGGHAGHQWMGNVYIRKSEDGWLKRYDDVLIGEQIPSDRSPTKKELENICKMYLREYKEKLPDEEAREVAERKRQNKITKAAREAEKTASSIKVE